MSLAPRINIVTLGVSDMPRARAFYEALGWPLEAEQSNEQVSFFRGTNVVLGLFGADSLAEDAHVKPEGHGFKAVTTAYNCLSEAEVDEAYAHAIRVGATAIKQPQKVFWGGYSGYFADPDGHLWEVAYNPFFPMDENGHIDFAAEGPSGEEVGDET